MKKVLIGLGILLAIAVIFAMALPSILKSRGLHPDYDGPSYELPGSDRNSLSLITISKTRV